MMAYRSLLVAAVAALGLGACGPTVTLTDSVDFTWDFGLTLDRFHDNLHTPYVRGSEMTVYVTSDDDKEEYRDWTIVSENPDVFRIMDDATADGTSLVQHGIATGVGDTHLTVLDGHGDVVGDGDVRVRVPDAIALDAHAYLILDRDDEARIEEVRMVEQGTATYLVNYFAGGEKLNGNGVLTTENAGGNVGGVDRQTFLFEDREWLTITTSAPGPGSLSLFADGEHVTELPIQVVPALDIADVTIISESEKKAKTGDWLVLLAQAYDTAGRKIMGIDFDWNVGGTQQQAVGDLYRYEFKKDTDEMVTVGKNGHSDAVMIHSESGYVDSSNNLGCSASGGSPVGWCIPMFGLLGVGGIARRRRRRAA